jgi:photosystem II stability/assembly factor-like uncharacterized protein
MKKRSEGVAATEGDLPRRRGPHKLSDCRKVEYTALTPVRKQQISVNFNRAAAGLDHKVPRGGVMKRSLCLFVTLIWCASYAAGQEPRSRPAPAKPAAPKTEQPKFKAIWEPVNYKEDLNLTDVFFASDEVGWVTGEHGTILHTKDGGNTWTPQLGGDPQSTEAKIGDLRFVDGTHGWANQNSKLLRTTDGENWEQVGKLGGTYDYLEDYIFTSANVGIQIRVQPYDIALTRDAGKTWKIVLPGCAAKMEIEGLTRTVECRLKSLHFPTPQVGYAIGTGAKALFALRTADGGESWSVSAARDTAGDSDVSSNARQEVFFTSENIGYVTLNDGKILTTTDGGQTWHGLVGNAGGKIKFPDPEVGWSIDGSKLTYTTNGGKTWSSRNFKFPADPVSFCFPSRQRAYVVSGHGMVYRYRVVPIEYTVKGMIDAPMMPENPAK